MFLAGTLPGELVQPGALTKRGPAWAADAAIIEASVHRVAPPCPHFGAGWKLGLLGDAVRRLGFAGDLPPLARTPPGGRRRIDLAIRRDHGALLIGLHARRSTAIANMHECPVLHPALFAFVQALRPVLRSMDGLKREGSAILNMLDSGPDLLLRTDATLSSGDRSRLTELATRLGVPRISWALGAKDQGARAGTEPACQLRPATTALAGRQTTVPPGAFLQASREGEAAIQAAILAALPPMGAKARIVELFAGCGTLTHGMTDRARVQAFEGDPVAVQALRAAANPRVTITVRDLARQPLMQAELKGAAAVVLDPPYNGALAQMPALAACGLPIVYVTCNPGALLRDGRILSAAGYRVASAVAIDQFLWSARVEGVVAFTRG